MDPITTTMLLSSIDQTLATVRAALTAGADSEQTEEAQHELSKRAGADVARLVASGRNPGWEGVPEAVSEAMERAAGAADRGDLQRVETELTVAREQLGGASR